MPFSIEALARYEAKFATSHGQIASLLRLGERRTVVLLHGNSSCKEVFAYVVPALLDAGYGVLVPDLPGHGNSQNAGNPERSYSFPGYAGAVAETIDAAGVVRPVIVGWSLGGHIAMELAASRREVAGVMVMGSPPIKPSSQGLEAAFFVTPTTLLAGKEEFNESDVDAYATAMLGTEDVDPFLRMRVRRTDGAARAHMFQNAMAGIGVDERLVAADPSKLFAIVHGAQDPFIRLGYLESLSYGRLWQQKIIVIEDCGHAPHWQVPEAFNAQLLTFIGHIDLH